MISVPTMERGFSTSELNFPDMVVKALLETTYQAEVSDNMGEATLYAGTPNWWSEVKTKLNGFKDLEENWDSYGASPIEEELIEKAFNLLLLSQLGNIPKPFVFPRKDGGVNFEWHKGDKFLSLEIRKDGMGYFFIDRLKNKPEEGGFEADNLDSIIELIN